jgi:hypothetical protein
LALSARCALVPQSRNQGLETGTWQGALPIALDRGPMAEDTGGTRVDA